MKIMTLKSYLKQENVAPHPHIELDFDVKFSLWGLLQFLIDFIMIGWDPRI